MTITRCDRCNSEGEVVRYKLIGYENNIEFACKHFDLCYPCLENLGTFLKPIDGKRVVK